jgi:hypothetical protein
MEDIKLMARDGQTMHDDNRDAGMLSADGRWQPGFPTGAATPNDLTRDRFERLDGHERTQATLELPIRRPDQNVSKISQTKKR